MKKKLIFFNHIEKLIQNLKRRRKINLVLTYSQKAKTYYKYYNHSNSNNNKHVHGIKNCSTVVTHTQYSIIQSTQIEQYSNIKTGFQRYYIFNVTAFISIIKNNIENNNSIQLRY